VDLEGSPVDPLAEEGLVTLFFVTSECPISNRYAPTYSKLVAEHPESKFYFVYPDPDDDPRDIRQHQQEYALPGPAIRDLEHHLVRASGVEVTPEAAVFSAGELAYRGRIDDRAVTYGEFRQSASKRDLHQALVALQQGRRPKAAQTKAVGCYIADLE
jgi:hypothetical protein